MTNLPLVSIIIPTYNNGDVVCQAIDCSLEQTYGNLEIIVVDDGSSDDTEEVVRERYHDRVIYLRQQNKGAGGARNTGVRQASGKYVQFLDADDLLASNKISIQMKELGKKPGKSLSYCDYLVCDMDRNPVKYKRVSPVIKSENPFDDIMLKWETELCIPVHCFMFDISFFKDHGVTFDESLQANEDWDCWMSIFALSPEVFFVDEVLAYYRVRLDSRCRNRVKMRESYLLAIDKQIQKNYFSKDVVSKLNYRKKQIKRLYKDESPLVRVLAGVHPVIKELYTDLVPWRIQRLFD